MNETRLTSPDLTASSGPDAVVSSSSETPEPARASRERPKDIEDVILVKFVLLVSVHTTSVNGAHFSEASNFQVLLCLNVLQSRAHGEQAHKCFEQTQPQPDYPAYILPLLPQGCVVQGRHHGLPHLLCSLRQGQPQCLFLIHDQIPVSQQQRGS